MADGNGGMTIEQWLEKHAGDKKAKPVKLKDGSTVYFRRPRFVEIRALAIAQDRGTPEECARAELEHVARLWCVDESGKPALVNPRQIHRLAEADLESVAELMLAANSIDPIEVEDEAKN